MMRRQQEQQLSQRLILSTQMKQSLHLLKLPITELSQMVSIELEQNPLLEVDDPSEEIEEFSLLTSNSSSFKEGGEDLRAFIENSYAEEESLFHYLRGQAKEHFKEKEEFEIAEELIGNINDKGLFAGNIDEISLLFDWEKEKIFRILKEIQTFDPPGIGALSVQEALLLQLKNKKKEGGLAYKIVALQYDNLIHNRIPLLAKAFHCDTDTIYEVIHKEITPLNTTPGNQFTQGHYRRTPLSITADVIIDINDAGISININEEKIPHIRVNEKYLKMLQDPQCNEETKRYIQEKLMSGKNFIKNIFERNQTLYRISEEIATFQRAFFLSGKATLLPMTMKELGRKLELHESTIARAASGKYMSTPHGMVAMRTFFTNGYTSQNGDKISATNVKELVEEIIQQENRMRPYSDEKIAELIQERGVACARRTIAKYRKELGLGNRGQRKVHS